MGYSRRSRRGESTSIMVSEGKVATVVPVYFTYTVAGVTVVEEMTSCRQKLFARESCLLKSY
jgi:hypothetical protein